MCMFVTVVNNPYLNTTIKLMRSASLLASTHGQQLLIPFQHIQSLLFQKIQ